MSRPCVYRSMTPYTCAARARDGSRTRARRCLCLLPCGKRCFRSAWRIGSAYVRVLPDPVGAETMTSRAARLVMALDDKMRGMTAVWMGKNFSTPSWRATCTISGCSFQLSAASSRPDREQSR
eukprot:scaffold3870_cov246-Pinguiococcus_pyrenoidosus.AAC.11